MEAPVLYSLINHDIVPPLRSRQAFTSSLQRLEISAKSLDFDLQQAKSGGALITEGNPVVIGTEDNIGMYVGLLAIYSLPQAVRTDYELSIPEQRRNLLPDILELILNEKLNVDAIARTLRERFPYYQQFSAEKIRASIQALISAKLLKNEIQKGKWVIVPGKRE